MEKFEKKLKMRIRVCWALIVLLLAAAVAIGEADSVLLDSRTIDATAKQASNIVYFGALIVLSVSIVRTRRLLRRSLDRRERQILEEDERRLEIRRRSGALTMNVLTALLLAAVFALAYVNMAAFYTAYAILMAALAVRGAAAAYYSRKL